LVDGEEIFVGIPPPSGPSASAAGGVVGGTLGASGPGGSGIGGAAGGGDPGNTAGEPVDLNTADATQLQTLPGVGAVLAARILAWRSAHGQFSAVSELEQVPGIGPAKYQALVGLVHV